MSGYIEQLERELVRAGRDHQRRRARFGALGAGWRPRVGEDAIPARVSLGGIVAVLGTAVAVTIVALAFVLLQHSRNQPAATIPAGTPASSRQLVSMLAVLRRPQTAADRAISASDLHFLEGTLGRSSQV